ncbi:hypothetical protein BV22DRAFT_1032366 [Leucogyrophana mollusca]|uniref:Uncharacterized protein n=1 Tax=Leucogyrophana mollusca TaxID=85980 RepID=A0ACB8BPX6_9AGAM|nr:hypothetical protein BV22DRAFT_1032366 [Leucogyrophana mollusca]
MDTDIRPSPAHRVQHIHRHDRICTHQQRIIYVDAANTRVCRYGLVTQTLQQLEDYGKLTRAHKYGDDTDE